MADRSSISSNDYTEATIEDAEVAIKGSSKTISPRTERQLSSSADAAKQARTVKAAKALDQAVMAEFSTPEDKTEKK
jgi:hypothetical protein